ncbi:CaiB/BaiF CoA transferase family protein [Chloroflexota bacterium]
MLSPYRVLDLTDEKGLLCGKILADLGADVIQVEPIPGNSARKISPFVTNETGVEQSLFWSAFSAGKKSITLNLETTAGKDIFIKLAGNADFIIESFPLGYLENLGLGYSKITEINPKIIMASITPFGRTGPYRSYKAGDLVATAMGGMAYCTGEPDRAPVRISMDQAYSQVSVHASVGLLIALNNRSVTGRGQYIDVSMQESIVRTLHTQLPYWEYSNRIVQRSGIKRFRGGVSTQEIWPCKDGFISWMFFGGTVGARQMQLVVEWMESKGMAGILRDEIKDWSTLDLTTVSPEKIKEWEEVIGSFFLAHTKQELYKDALEKRIPLTPLNDISDVAGDEHLAARNFWKDISHPDLHKSIPHPGFLFKTTEDKCKPVTRGRAPLTGEHNQEIYQGILGIGEEEMESLRSSGII